MDSNVADTMAVVLNRKALAEIRMGVVFRTASDIRVFADKVVDSALPGQPVSFLPSSRQLQWDNGSVAFLFSSSELDSMRGSQWAFSIGFDAHEWGMAIVDMVQFNTRIGPDAESIILY